MHGNRLTGQLIVQEMVGAPTRDTDSRELILGHRLRVFVARPTLVVCHPWMLVQMLFVRVFLCRFDNGIGLNWGTVP